MTQPVAPFPVSVVGVGNMGGAMAQRLLGLIEHGPAPDVHMGLAAEAEEALLLPGVDQQRDQQAVARCRDAGARARPADNQQKEPEEKYWLGLGDVAADL